MVLFLFALGDTRPLSAATKDGAKATGSLTVKIKPKDARQDGARWRVDGGAWRKNGKTVDNLDTGSHQVSFKEIIGWKTPKKQTVTINANTKTSATGKYVTVLSGSISATITPEAATTAGAQWRVDDREWRDSGDTEIGLSVGEHTVTFKQVAGWITPEHQNVEALADQTTAVYGDYTFETQTSVMLPDDVPLEMVWIPAGSFMMGRYTNEQDSTSDESPQHQVTFANGFWMAKYEVTQAQWLALMGSNPSNFTGDLNRPVEQVSWNDVQSCIAALNAHVVNTGQGAGTFHLPSEAQWEYACRAGTTTRFYWGDDASYTQIEGYAWYSGNAGPATHPVGQKLPNAFGLYDMSGNVWECCEDWFHATYTGAPTDGSAWVLPTGSYRMNRGGSWYDPGEVCRSARRGSISPTSTGPLTGFRLAR
jgi:formylglycine-generating enzyme required for sulfatase activity